MIKAIVIACIVLLISIVGAGMAEAQGVPPTVRPTPTFIPTTPVDAQGTNVPETVNTPIAAPPNSSGGKGVAPAGPGEGDTNVFVTNQGDDTIPVKILTPVVIDGGNLAPVLITATGILSTTQAAPQEADAIPGVVYIFALILAKMFILAVLHIGESNIFEKIYDVMITSIFILVDVFVLYPIMRFNLLVVSGGGLWLIFWLATLHIHGIIAFLTSKLPRSLGI